MIILSDSWVQIWDGLQTACYKMLHTSQTMPKENLQGDLLSLERKLKLLLSEYNNIKEEVEHLKAENNDLKELIRQKDGQLGSFQNQLKISKIVQNVAVGEDTDATGLKNQIDEYIKEIDRCIAQLSES